MPYLEGMNLIEGQEQESDGKCCGGDDNNECDNIKSSNECLDNCTWVTHDNGNCEWKNCTDTN